ncbi:MAG: TolC family protein [Oligoflexia bacterium]|nr:TolC family protein [Oligoflexia bacterium]
MKSGGCGVVVNIKFNLERKREMLMRDRKILTKIAIVVLNSWMLAASANVLFTPENYLQQVQNKNQGILASKESSSAYKSKSQEGELLFSPSLFATTQVLDDQKQTASLASMGERTLVETYSVGVSDVTKFGLQSKVSYIINHYDINGASLLYLPKPKYYEAKSGVDLTFPILRNFLSKEYKAMNSATKASSMAAYYGESYKQKMLLAEAEMTYWRLVLARETVLIQKESLERAQKIRDWNQERYNKQLADKTDLLQSEAATEGRKIELQMALDEEQSSMRSFNSIRGIDSDSVNESLVRLDTNNYVEKIIIPEFKDLRDDVKAQEQQKLAVNASSEISNQKITPALDLYGSLYLNGKKEKFGDTFNQSVSTNYPTVTVGVKFTMPLDFGLTKDLKNGYILEKQGAEINFQKKLFDQKREWHDLKQKLAEAKKRLRLTSLLAESQKLKLKHEREQHKKGRSTTFQVLLFEQDHDTAKLNNIRIKTEILKIIAQMKTF